jgi:hypothetical protein
LDEVKLGTTKLLLQGAAAADNALLLAPLYPAPFYFISLFSIGRSREVYGMTGNLLGLFAPEMLGA